MEPEAAISSPPFKVDFDQVCSPSVSGEPSFSDDVIIALQIVNNVAELNVLAGEGQAGLSPGRREAGLRCV